MIYKRILLTTDGSENNKVAIEDGIELAKELDADVTVLSVIDSSRFTAIYDSIPFDKLFPRLDEESRMAVDRAVGEGKKRGVRIKGKVVDGNPVEEMIKESMDHDLIVMGSLGRTGLSHLLMGGVAEKVVRFATRPVVLVRNDRDDRDPFNSSSER